MRKTISTAEHPPLYPLILSILPALGTLSLTAARMFSVVFGCGTVVVVALIGRRIAGQRVGLIAAVLCAVYPSFVAADGSIMSEPLFGLLVGLVVLQGLRLRERQRTVDGLLLGALIGLATLTRSEALILLVLVGAPAIVGATSGRLRVAARHGDRGAGRRLSVGRAQLGCLWSSDALIQPGDGACGFELPGDVSRGGDGRLQSSMRRLDPARARRK